MSRNPCPSKRQREINPPAVNDGNPADDIIIEQAHALYGSEAATAFAFCGLDAWFDGEEDRCRRFAGLFRRLRN